MICPKCSAQIPEHSLYCPICGTDTSGIQNAGSAFCPFCGAENERDAQFCIVCGADIWNVEQKCEAEKRGIFSLKSRKLVIGVIIAAMLAATGTAIFLMFFCNGGETQKMQKQERQISERKEETSSEESTRIHQNLQASLKNYIQTNGVNGSVSVYYEELSSGESFCYHSHSMRAGQSGRIFVFEYLMEAVANGKMQPTEELMHTIKLTATGDEPASHRLVAQITGDFAEGLDRVSEYVQERGYSETIINRFNGDSGNNTSTMPNQTSARDTAQSMKHIYKTAEKGNLFAQDLIDILATDVSLKKGISTGVKQSSTDIAISNLEASWTECENDVAVLIGKGKTVILSIAIAELTDSESEHEAAMGNIHEISRQVCEKLL